MKATMKDGVLRSPYPMCDIPCCSIYSAFKTWVESSPEKIILVDDKLKLTPVDFFTRAKRYAAGFQAYGIKPGDRICVHLDNSVDNLTAMFGLVFAGATLILADSSLTERDLQYQTAAGDASRILTDPKNEPKANRIRKMLDLKDLFVIGATVEAINVSKFSSTDENSFKELPIPDPKATVVALAFTAGTAGLPKAVEITHHSFVANLQTSRSPLTDEARDVILAWHPVSHMAGFLFIPVAATAGSTCVVVSPSLPFEKLASVVNDYKVTMIPSSPAVLQRIADEMRRTGIQLDSVKKINVGGAALTDSLVGALKAAFKNLRCITSVYIPSEACGIVCAAEDVATRAASMGFPGPMVELKIVDVTTGEKLGPNKAGELYYKIPNVMKGYYKNPKKTAEFMDADGWCRSGDMAHYDEDGRVHFVGRLQDMIKCMGQEILPAELEELLLKHHDGIAEVAVAGLPHRKYGEVATAFVVLKQTHKQPGKVCEEDIERTVSGLCDRHKHLHGGVYFVHRLPKTQTGKVKRSALKAHAISTSTF